MLQGQALALLKQGHNVFLTGCAGSGKTYTLNQYYHWLRTEKKLSYAEVALTASTGIAATHINGRTIHSWAGIGISKEIEPRILKKIVSNRRIVERIQAAKVLVIDEISMLHRKQFELIEKVVSLCRHSEQPFGGLQVIICGDFFQLPPIPTKGKQETDQDLFCFNSPVWTKSHLKVCYLTEQHRIKNGQLNDILNAIRSSSITNIHRETLEKTSEKKYDDQKLHLFTHNKNVDQLNQQHLHAIRQPLYQFSAVEHGAPDLIKELKNSVLAPEILDLKVGAKVLFIKNNLDQGYVNGTQGTVIEFQKDVHNQIYPVVETQNHKRIKVYPLTWEMLDEKENVIASITQIPLVLAWAITIHKSQGMSLQEANIDLKQTFVDGQGYVAISRLTTIAGLHLMGLSVSALELNSSVKNMDGEFQNQSRKNELLLQSNKETERDGIFDFIFIDDEEDGEQFNLDVKIQESESNKQNMLVPEDAVVDKDKIGILPSTIRKYLMEIQIENLALETRIKNFFKAQGFLNAAEAYEFLQLHPKIDGIGTATHVRATQVLEKLRKQMTEDPAHGLMLYVPQQQSLDQQAKLKQLEPESMLPAKDIQIHLECIPIEKVVELDRRVINKLLENNKYNALDAYVFLKTSANIQGLGPKSCQKSLVLLDNIINKLIQHGESIVNQYLDIPQQHLAAERGIEMTMEELHHFNHPHFNLISEFGAVFTCYGHHVCKHQNGMLVLKQRYGIGCEARTLQEIADFLTQSKSNVQVIHDQGLNEFDQFLRLCVMPLGHQLNHEVSQHYMRLKSLILTLNETHFVFSESLLQDLITEEFGYALEQPYLKMLMDIMGYKSIPQRVIGFKGQKQNSWLKKEQLQLYKDIILKCNLIFENPISTDFFDVVVECKRSIACETAQVRAVLKTIKDINMADEKIVPDIRYLNLPNQLYRAVSQLGPSNTVKQIQIKVGQLLAASIDTLPSEESIRNTMSRDQRFQPQGKSGLWSLTEHNLENEKIIDVMQSALIRAGSALSAEQIEDIVLNVRPDASKKSIASYLARRNFFIKNELGLYELTRWQVTPMRVVSRKNTLDEKQFLEDLKMLFSERMTWKSSDLKHLLAEKHQVDLQTIHSRLKKLQGVERSKGVTDQLTCLEPSKLMLPLDRQRRGKGSLIQDIVREYLQQLDSPQAKLIDVKTHVFKIYPEMIESSFYHYLDKMSDVKKVSSNPVMLSLVP